MKKNVIWIVIGLYFVGGIILPFIFKFCIFENPALSNLSNNEWAGFLGSYVGGIIGGLGTLIAMYYTVKCSFDLQETNRVEAATTLQEELERRDEEYKRDKEDREKERREDEKRIDRSERVEFTNTIAQYLGTYIAEISKYHYASIYAESLNEKEKDTKEKFEKAIKSVKHNQNAFSTLNLTKLKYEEASLERMRNSEQGNRLEANKVYFSMKVLLKDVSEADELINKLEILHKNAGIIHPEIFYSDWIDNKTNELITEYQNFRKAYINKA